MTEIAALTLIAYILDLLIGDPSYSLHPVRIIGRWIEILETVLRRSGLDGATAGFSLALTTILTSLGAFLLISFLAELAHPWAARLFHLYIIYSCLALGDLFQHVKPVVQRLQADDLPGARLALSRIVGREVKDLDRWGIARAAVETLAENFVDGFLSPLFWLFIGAILAKLTGLSIVLVSICAILTFKCASTLDSMIGYKNKRYIHFGRTGALLDDIMNFVPARLSIPVLFLGAIFSDSNPIEGLRTSLRDRLKHDSPNAGHAESFTAGALGVCLGGPTQYEGAIKDKSWLGLGTPCVNEHQILATVTLLRRSSWLPMLALMYPFFLP